MGFFGFLIDLALAVKTSLKLQIKGRAGFLQNHKKSLPNKRLIDPKATLIKDLRPL